MAPVNPKDIAAQTEGRARLDLLEPAADEQIARALAAGADKYGLRNFTISPIEARTYVAAMRRHLAAFLSGEDFAEDTGLHHLAHVGANVHVVLAAIEASTFIDDRSPAPVENPYLPTEYADNLDVEDYGGCKSLFPVGAANPDCDDPICVDLGCRTTTCPLDEPVFETCPASHAEIQSFWRDAGRPQDDECKGCEPTYYSGCPNDDDPTEESPTFKTGDTVRLVKDNYDKAAGNALHPGAVGTVLDGPGRGGRVRVDFPSSTWGSPPDRWWDCDLDEIEPVEEKPPVRRRAVLIFGARGSEVLAS